MTRHLALFAGLLAIAPVAARAQSQSGTQSLGKSTTVDRSTTPTGTSMRENRAANMHLTEDQLLAQLHKINQQEIMAGQLAEKKGSSSQVKDYGRMLVQDHEKADKQVKEVADKAHVSLTSTANLPQALQEQDKVNQSKMQQVQRLSGKEFDKAFAQVMSNGHQEAIDMVKNAEANAKGDLKNLLDTLVPELQKHKDVADQILSSSGNTASSK
jgi:putative membrane protein